MATKKNTTDDKVITGTSKADKIKNTGDNVTISGGAKNVIVIVDGGKNTIKGDELTIITGTGNITLTGSSSKQTYQYIGGDEVVTNYSYEDTIEITKGKITGYSFDGGDLIFHIGDGSMRLKGMTNHYITVKDSSGKTTTEFYGNGYSPQQVIKNFVQSMSRSLLNYEQIKTAEAIKACSGFNSIEEVVDKFAADIEAAPDAETFLHDYCGINEDMYDDGSVLSWQTGGQPPVRPVITHFEPGFYTSWGNTDKYKYATGDAVYPSSNTFTIRGLKITVPDKSKLNEKQQLMVKGFYSWWAEDAIGLLEDSYGIHFNGQKIRLTLNEHEVNSASDDYINLNGQGDIGGELTEDNLRYFCSDLVAHEMTHVMQDNFGLNTKLVRSMTEGMASLTEGYNSHINNIEVIIYYLKNNLSDFRKLGFAYLNNYNAGYTFRRYLMKQASDSYDSSKDYAWKDNSSIVGTSKADLLTANAKKQTISAGAGNDTITAYGEKMKIFGDSGNDSILTGASAKNLTVSAGQGNDTILNNASKISILGGDGNDFIGNEKGGNTVTITGGPGNDTIRNYGSKVTIDGGAGNDSIRNSGYNVSINGGDGNDYLSGGANSTISGGTGNDTISNISSNASISGGAGDDNIINSAVKKWNSEILKYYDVSPDNVTIVGGTGNDKISLMSPAENTVVYNAGDGNDTIWGFNEGTTFQIGNGTGTYSADKKGKNVIVTVGDGKITLVDATNLSAVNIEGKDKNSWKIAGDTATYGIITVKGIADGATAKNFALNDKTITIGKAAVQTDGTEVKLSNKNYTLKLGKNMTAPKMTATFKNGKYTLKNSTAGYVVDTDKNTIKYSAANTTVLELSGVASKPSAPSDNVVNLKLANFDKNLSVVSNANDYKFSIAEGTYGGKTFTGSSNVQCKCNR